MQTTNNIRMVRSLMSQLRNASNPTVMLCSMAEQNPNLKMVLDMTRGKSPKDLFYEKAREMGVNPDDILNQLRQI